MCNKRKIVFPLNSNPFRAFPMRPLFGVCVCVFCCALAAIYNLPKAAKQIQYVRLSFPFVQFMANYITQASALNAEFGICCHWTIMHRVRPFIIIIIIMSFLLLCVSDSANDAKKWPTLDDSTNTHIHSSKQIVCIFLFLLVRKTSLLSTPLFWCVLCPNAITFAFYHLCIAFNLFVLLCNQIYS